MKFISFNSRSIRVLLIAVFLLLIFGSYNRNAIYAQAKYSGHLAATIYDTQANASHLYLIDVDKSDIQRLDKVDRVGSFSWSPSGNMIAYEALENGGVYLVVHDMASENESQVYVGKDQEVYLHEITWSQDETSIAFILQLDGNENRRDNLVTLTLAESRMSVILEDIGLVQLLKWSPTSNEVIVGPSSQLQAEFFRVNIQTGEKQALTDEKYYVVDSVLSPDRNQIAFLPFDSGATCNINILDLTDNHVTVICLTPIETDHFNISWSPDQRNLVYSARYTGFGSVSEIFIVDVEGKSLHKIEDVREEAWYPEWSPDGNRIAFTKDNGFIYLVDIQTLKVSQLTDFGHTENQPTYLWRPIPPSESP